MGLAELRTDGGLVHAHHGRGFPGGALEPVAQQHGVALALGEPGHGGVEADGVGQYLVLLIGPGLLEGGLEGADVHRFGHGGSGRPATAPAAPPLPVDQALLEDGPGVGVEPVHVEHA